MTEYNTDILKKRLEVVRILFEDKLTDEELQEMYDSEATKGSTEPRKGKE
jgi:hypothetical protein